MKAIRDCHSLAQHGDEWFIAYACAPPLATSAVLFSVRHAVELYLKAAHVAAFGDITKAIKYGHKVIDLWDACKAEDPSFMSSYLLRKEIFAIDFLDSTAVAGLSTQEQLHYLKNQQIYLLFKHLQDLKYFGLPWKTRDTLPKAMAFLHPDPLWISFFRALRSHIGYPRLGCVDRIAQLLELNALPQAAAIYLRDLYAPLPNDDV